jgi:hypothetical protein
MDGIPLAPRASKPPGGPLTAWLAGLQGGMLGALWMLAWMGVSSAWQQRGFWTAENLFATVFYGGSAVQPGCARGTVSGLALYLVMYSLLGAAFAAAVHGRLPRGKILLAAVAFGAAWYFVSFRMLWKTAMPLVFLLHSEQPTFLGHLIYGTFLGRFPIYLEPARMAAPPPAEPSVTPATPVPTQSSSPRDPA